MVRESLLGQPGGAPEEAADGDSREHHPDDSWRADALGRSRHARLTDHIREPLDDPDPATAHRVCAEVTRDALGDLAPALILVNGAERFRCQVLTTWVRTLFDFARQTGVEGERLAALNRLEFGLEQALDGDPPGQPVFVGMAIEETRRPWPRESLDLLLAAARRRAVRPRLDTVDEVAAEAAQIARALGLSLVGSEPSSGLAEQWAALVRLRGLLDLGEAVRRDQASLPRLELPSPGDLREPADAARTGAAVRSELARIRPALDSPLPVRELPAGFRRAARYLRLAGLALWDRIETSGGELSGGDTRSSPLRLGVGARLGLLLRASLGGR